MHELSLVHSLLELTDKQTAQKPIKSTILKVGLLSCVETRALVSCFDTVKQRYSKFSRCNLDILVCFPQAKCKHCNRSFELQVIGAPCQCGSHDYVLTGGNDLTVSSVEYF